jgi:hypothetical protein
MLHKWLVTERRIWLLSFQPVIRRWIFVCVWKSLTKRSTFRTLTHYGTYIERSDVVSSTLAFVSVTSRVQISTRRPATLTEDFRGSTQSLQVNTAIVLPTSFHISSNQRVTNISQNYWVFGLFPSSAILQTRNMTFQKLDLFPSLGGGEDTWARKQIQFPKRHVF